MPPNLHAFLPLLLAVIMACAGCTVMPLSLHQTLPSNRVALANIERAQRSLDALRREYANSAEAVRPVAAYGATQAAYQRWVMDEVRELPEGLETITLGGGDQ